MENTEKKKICFFCHSNEDGTTEGEYKDYVPCDKCLSVMNQGITFICVETEPVLDENQPPIADIDETKWYPTGHFVILKEESFDKMFESNEVTEQIKKDKNTIIPSDRFFSLFKNVLTEGDPVENTETENTENS